MAGKSSCPGPSAARAESLEVSFCGLSGVVALLLPLDGPSPGASAAAPPLPSLRSFSSRPGIFFFAQQALPSFPAARRWPEQPDNHFQSAARCHAGCTFCCHRVQAQPPPARRTAPACRPIPSGPPQARPAHTVTAPGAVIPHQDYAGFRCTSNSPHEQ